MLIKRIFWYFDNVGALAHISCKPMRCVRCDRLLSSWYCYIVQSLEELIPKNFEHFCCSCTLKKALGLQKCPNCKEFAYIADAGDGQVGIECNNCQSVLTTISYKECCSLQREEILKNWGGL